MPRKSKGKPDTLKDPFKRMVRNARNEHNGFTGGICFANTVMQRIGYVHTTSNSAKKLALHISAELRILLSEIRAVRLDAQEKENKNGND